MQAPLPAGYPGVVSAATPSNPLAGLALPQPTNSGSLDLSSIKPVSSGNVSLADAIAKARTSGGGGGRNDRYNGRRSRSRSPRRDDPYNNNPFRDERRNDNRRRSPGRGTPSSPGGNFPGYIGRSYAPGMPTSEMLDERTEVITVESSSVGLIIGRAGENLKRVEGDSGARVQFMTQTEGPYRKCKITGDPGQRAAAIQDIYKTALENPKRNTNPAPAHYNNNNNNNNNPDNDPPLREGERSLQIMVPDKTVGLIIGRRGETIQDLQERSGCHINILGENKSINGLRPVNLIGTREASDKAQVLIAEVVKSDTRSGQQGGGGSAPPLMHSAYGAPSQMSYDPYAPQQIPHYGRPGPDPNDKISETIYIPSEAVGMVIGKGGETIKDMQTTHGCKINVSQPSGSDIQREIGLIGSRPAIEGAKRAIWDKVHTVVSVALAETEYPANNT